MVRPKQSHSWTKRGAAAVATASLAAVAILTIASRSSEPPARALEITTDESTARPTDRDDSSSEDTLAIERVAVDETDTSIVPDLPDSSDASRRSPVDSPIVRREIRISGESYTEELSAMARRLRFATGELYAEMPLVDGKRDGESRCWYRSGQLHADEHFVSGERDGRAVYFSESGTRIAEGDYRRGLRDGLWQTWYPDGRRESEGRYGSSPADSTGELEGAGAAVRRGRSERVGAWTWWRPDGSVDASRSGNYVHGEREGG